MLLKHLDHLHFLQKLNWSLLDGNKLKDLEAEFNQTIERIEVGLHTCKTPSILKEMICRNEEHDFIPIRLGFLVYQKLIQLEENKVLALQSFSDYLLRYGADWQEEAEHITVALKNNDLDKAVLIAQKVDYDKYQ